MVIYFLLSFGALTFTAFYWEVSWQFITAFKAVFFSWIKLKNFNLNLVYSDFNMVCLHGFLCTYHLRFIAFLRWYSFSSFLKICVHCFVFDYCSYRVPRLFWDASKGRAYLTLFTVFPMSLANFSYVHNFLSPNITASEWIFPSDLYSSLLIFFSSL